MDKPIGKDDLVPHADEPMSDQEIEALRRKRFEARVKRVLDVMQKEKIDFRGIPFFTPEGAIRARVMPVEMQEQP